LFLKALSRLHGSIIVCAIPFDTFCRRWKQKNVQKRKKTKGTKVTQLTEAINLIGPSFRPKLESVFLSNGTVVVYNEVAVAAAVAAWVQKEKENKLSQRDLLSATVQWRLN
jgi:hypothetical protein